MEREVKKRKKQFGAYFLALVLVLTAVMPQFVMAAVYDITDDYHAIEGKELYPGDDITYYQDVYAGPTKVYYYDCDGAELFVWENIVNNSSDENFIVREYTDDEFNTEGSLEEVMFKCWKVDYVSGSADAMTILKLTAVAYEEYDITYELDGGTNGTNNPDTYVEGTGVTTLADASKEGYTFEGWYTADTFADDTKVTSIAATLTGDITLYAKFTEIQTTEQTEPTVTETGDNAMTNWLLALMLLSGGAFAMLVLSSRKKKVNDM
ncbi:MAG: hypothetical protein E7266_06940 [Lachnospiraceae bacterium]|nr:hypothetical protein [Lachnospiraceae bacterium]